MSTWDRDKTAPLASSETFLAGPSTESTCFHVGGQASKQVPKMRFGTLNVGGALWASGPAASPVQPSPVPFGGQIFPYSVGNVVFP